jgi:uncharacterized protein YggE
MKLTTLALSTLFFASLAVAQPPAPIPHVSAQGTGEIQATPDIAKLSVESVNNDGSPLDAAKDTRKDMATIVAAARRFVRNPNDLLTTRLAVNPVYEWVEGKRKFRGYDASQTLEITLRDVSKVDSLIAELLKTNLTTLGNLEFRHSKSDSLHREALAVATRDARDNAFKICGSLGLTCDEIMSVRMSGTGQGPMPLANQFRMAKADGGGMPVQMGVLTFTAMVEADFKLK